MERPIAILFRNPRTTTQQLEWLGLPYKVVDDEGRTQWHCPSPDTILRYWEMITTECIHPITQEILTYAQLLDGSDYNRISQGNPQERSAPKRGDLICTSLFEPRVLDAWFGEPRSPKPEPERIEIVNTDLPEDPQAEADKPALSKLRQKFAKN